MEDDPGKLLSLARDQMDQGRFREALNLIHQFKKYPGDMLTDEHRFKFHLLSAREHVFRNEYVEGAKHCLKAMRFAEETGDEAARAQTMRWLGYIHWRKGDFHMARVYISEGLEVGAKLGDRELQGILHTELGNVRNSLGDTNGAAKEFGTAIDLLEGTDNLYELSRAYNNLGDHHYVKGDWEKAAGIFRKCKEIGSDAAVNVAWASFNLGDCLCELGRIEEARAEIGSSIPVLEEAGDEMGLLYAYQTKGHMHGRAKEWAAAFEALGRARELAARTCMPVEEGKVIMSFGRVYKWKGDIDRAREHFEMAREIFGKHDAITFKTLVEGELEAL